MSKNKRKFMLILGIACINLFQYSNNVFAEESADTDICVIAEESTDANIFDINEEDIVKLTPDGNGNYIYEQELEDGSSFDIVVTEETEIKNTLTRNMIFTKGVKYVYTQRDMFGNKVFDSTLLGTFEFNGMFAWGIYSYHTFSPVSSTTEIARDKVTYSSAKVTTISYATVEAKVYSLMAAYNLVQKVGCTPSGASVWYANGVYYGGVSL